MPDAAVLSRRSAKRNPPVIATGDFPRDGQEHGECCCCDQPATGFVVVQYTGERVSEPACRRHRKMATAGDGRFFAHKKTKGRYLAGELARRPE